MNYIFEGSITNKLKNPDTSVTVFRNKDEVTEKLLDPFYTPDSQNLPRIESWKNNIKMTIAVNHPIGEEKQCKVTKVEQGSCSGPNKVGNFKWELEVTSTKESYKDPNTAVEVEISDS